MIVNLKRKRVNLRRQAKRPLQKNARSKNLQRNKTKKLNLVKVMKILKIPRKLQKRKITNQPKNINALPNQLNIS